MAVVNVTSVNILNNPSPFSEPFQFEIQYECLTALEHDLEWKVTYVGSADTEEYDQVLDSVLVGPVTAGQYRFVLQPSRCVPIWHVFIGLGMPLNKTNAPDASKLRQDDIIGITIILLSCLYKDKEFLRVGYYVNNDYSEPEMRESPPDVVQVNRLVRSLLEDKPRVTRFPIEWDELPQSIPTIGDENQPPLINQDQSMEEDVGFQKPAAMDGAFGQTSSEYNQAVNMHSEPTFGGFHPAQPGFVDHGSAMEE